MFLTKKHLSRRTMLRGMGATIALPLFDSMIPARSVFAQTSTGKAAARTRLICIEQVHGAAGSTEFGAANFLWSPQATGKAFDLSKGSLAPLERFRDYLTVVSNTDVRMAEALAPAEVGGDLRVAIDQVGETRDRAVNPGADPRPGEHHQTGRAVVGFHRGILGHPSPSPTHPLIVTGSETA